MVHGAGLRAERGRACRQRGHSPGVRRCRPGVAIVPRLAIEPRDARTQAIGLEEVVPERQIAIFWHRDRVHGDGLEVFRRATIKIAGDLGTCVRPVELAAA
ncbi:MAG TPA: hypothetical protein VI122_04445 [Thermoleophilaceae bacterium]